MASVAICASSVLAFNALIDELLAVNRDRYSVEPAGPELAVEAGYAICFSIVRPVEVWAAFLGQHVVRMPGLDCLGEGLGLIKVWI